MKKELGDPGKAGMTLNEEERKEGRKVRWKCLRLQSSPKGSLAELLGVLSHYVRSPSPLRKIPHGVAPRLKGEGKGSR